MRSYIFLACILLSNFVQANSPYFIQLTSTEGNKVYSKVITENIAVEVDNNSIYIEELVAFGFRADFSLPHNNFEKKAYLTTVVPNDTASYYYPEMSIVNSNDFIQPDCVSSPGVFYIYEIEPQNNILAMDFLLQCNLSDETIKGSIRVNSNLPTPYDKPFPIIKINQSRVLDTSFTLDGSKSFSNVNKITNFEWQQESGPSVSISTPNANTTDVEVIENVELGGEPAVFSLSVTDDKGQEDQVMMPIFINSKSDRFNYVKTSIEPITSGGFSQWYADIGLTPPLITDLHPSQISTSLSGLGETLKVEINFGMQIWSATFQDPTGRKLDAGIYLDADKQWMIDSPLKPKLIINDGKGKSCDDIVGEFEILKFTTQAENVDQLHIIFSQQCKDNVGLLGPELTGEIAINLSDENVPTANAGSNMTVTSGARVMLDGGGSSDDSGELTFFNWSSSESDVQFEQPNSQMTSFIAPVLSEGVDSINIPVSLLVKDLAGYQSKDTIIIKVVKQKKESNGSSSGGGISALFVFLLAVFALFRFIRFN